MDNTKCIKTNDYYYVTTNTYIKNSTAKISFKTRSDAHIGLVSSRGVVGEIIIGAYDNTRNILRNKMQGSNQQERSSKYCNEHTFKSIYISYLDNEVLICDESKFCIFRMTIDNNHDKLEIVVSSWNDISCLWQIENVNDFSEVTFKKWQIDSNKSKQFVLNKTIWLLWLQGWNDSSCSWLAKQVAESWSSNNPDWKIEYVTLDNLKNYVNDIDYIYDKSKTITNAALSDIIRLSLLKNHGGVWADSTLLCMQPLDHWINEAIACTGTWMYHGNGADMIMTIGSSKFNYGPASWFIVSVVNSPILVNWKKACDEYWTNNNDTDNYLWMDSLFRKLYETDDDFKTEWLKTPYLSCEEYGQSHCLSYIDVFIGDDVYLKETFRTKPPYVIKLWNNFWNDIFPDTSTYQCQNSNSYYAIQMSKRKFVYKHEMFSIEDVVNTNKI